METLLFQQSTSENPKQTCRNVTFWTARQPTSSRLLALWNSQSSSLEVQLRWKTPYCKSFSIYITIGYTTFDRNLLYKTAPLEVLSWLSLSACLTLLFQCLLISLLFLQLREQPAAPIKTNQQSQVMSSSPKMCREIKYLTACRIRVSPASNPYLATCLEIHSCSPSALQHTVPLELCMLCSIQKQLLLLAVARRLHLLGGVLLKHAPQLSYRGSAHSSPVGDPRDLLQVTRAPRC